MSINNGSTSFGNGGSELQPPRRHQPGRHREHRDREGTVGRDAVRHRRGERRHRHHDQEGPRRRRRAGRLRRRRRARRPQLVLRQLHARRHQPDDGRSSSLIGPVHARHGLARARACKSDGTHGYDSLRVYSPIKDPTRHAARLRLSQRRRAFRSPAAPTRFATSCRPAATTKSGVFKLDRLRAEPLRLARRHDPSVAGAPEHASAEQLPREHQRAASTRSSTPTVNFGYSTVDALTSNESNNTVGIGSQAFGGPGYRNNGLVERSARLARRLSRRNAGPHLGGEAPAERQPHDHARRTSTGVRRAGCRRAPTSAPTSPIASTHVFT